MWDKVPQHLLNGPEIKSAVVDFIKAKKVFSYLDFEQLGDQKIILTFTNTINIHICLFNLRLFKPDNSSSCCWETAAWKYQILIRVFQENYRPVINLYIL